MAELQQHQCGAREANSPHQTCLTPNPLLSGHTADRSLQKSAACDLSRLLTLAKLLNISICLLGGLWCGISTSHTGDLWMGPKFCKHLECPWNVPDFQQLPVSLSLQMMGHSWSARPKHSRQQCPVFNGCSFHSRDKMSGLHSYSWSTHRRLFCHRKAPDLPVNIRGSLRGMQRLDMQITVRRRGNMQTSVYMFIVQGYHPQLCSNPIRLAC